MVIARNIDLSTVPERGSVQLTIYNAEDLTLVRETRRVSFKEGINPLQFSWTNTLIDPSSVTLTFLSHADRLAVSDTTFPHDKPQMLYWNVVSEFNGEALVEILYFTSGISWHADYILIANPEETNLHLESFVRVVNNSGEDYENAQVRLVVGTLNLVEKIAELAQRGSMRQQAERFKQQLHRNAVKEEMLEMEDVMPMVSRATTRGDAKMRRPKTVEKESLSEYFLYTIEGTETIPHGWAKRLRSFEAKAVPFNIKYRYRPQEYGDRLIRLYLLTNDTASKLGSTPLPDGMVRVFRENKQGGLSFLSRQSIKYVPIGDKLELNLGEDPEVLFELIKLKVFRDEIWMYLRGPNIYHKIGGGIQIGSNSHVAGWDAHTVYTQRIRNYSPKPIEAEIRRMYDGDTVFRSSLKPELHDYRTVQLTATVDASEQADLYHEVIVHHGRNATKNNVELEESDLRLWK
jgi:hypothetical protein